jgi:Zn-dependent peptidase ImmA (M78 family)
MNASNPIEYSIPIPSNLSRNDVWKLAEKVASDLGVKVGLPLAPFVEQMGGKIELKDVDDLQESGAIVIKNEHDFTIFLPFHTGAKRDRFTIGHELGHYFLHYKLPAIQGRTPKLPMIVSRYGTDRTETEANWFAAAFLMPSANFKRAYQAAKGNLVAVADEFDVSRSAAAVRADSLGLSSLTQSEELPF